VVRPQWYANGFCAGSSASAGGRLWRAYPAIGRPIGVPNSAGTSRLVMRTHEAPALVVSVRRNWPARTSAVLRRLRTPEGEVPAPLGPPMALPVRVAGYSSRTVSSM
jgi:hypothetical protein